MHKRGADFIGRFDPPEPKHFVTLERGCHPGGYRDVQELSSDLRLEMKNLVLASIIAFASAMSASMPAEAAIPMMPLQAPAAGTAATVVDYYRGPRRGYYRGPYRSYYRGPYRTYYGRNYYAGANCYMKRVKHYRHGRVYVDRVRVCR